MLAREIPAAIVCVAEDRYLAGVLAERALGATIHLLDDGFQHVQLERDLDVLVTTMGEIPNGHVLPRGRLREAADAAARAHCLVVMGATAGAATSEGWTLGIGEACGGLRRVESPRRVPGTELRSGGDRDRESGVRRRATAIGSGTREGLSGAELLPGARVLLVAGIANPQRFAEDVRAAGWDVAGEMWFADHHAFTAADVARIAVKARESRAAAVFTTDKDAVRFETLGPVPFPLFAVPLTVEFDPPTILFERVSSVLSARSAHPGPEFSGAEAYRRPADGNRSPAGGLR